MYRCGSWTMKNMDRGKNDSFKKWCSRIANEWDLDNPKSELSLEAKRLIGKDHLVGESGKE